MEIISSSISSVVSSLGDIYPPLWLYSRLPLQADHLFLSSQKPELLRLGIGLIGNAVSLLLYAAPILTFKKVIKERSTGEFSSVPYVAALLNCLIYAWYGSPMVSSNWDNLPLFTINCFGAVLEFSFVLIYIFYASSRGKKITSLLAAPVIGLSIGMVALTSSFSDLHLRKSVVGSCGIVANVAMYSAPLVVVKRVIQTKSVEFMPFSLSLFSFLASSLWTTYGLLSNDLLLAFPNLLGCPLGLLQLLLYCKYNKKPSALEEPLKVGVEEAVSCKIDVKEKEEQPFRLDEEATRSIVEALRNESFRLMEIEENNNNNNEIRMDLNTPLIISVCA